MLVRLFEVVFVAGGGDPVHFHTEIQNIFHTAHHFLNSLCVQLNPSEPLTKHATVCVLICLLCVFWSQRAALNQCGIMSCCLSDATRPHQLLIARFALIGVDE